MEWWELEASGHPYGRLTENAGCRGGFIDALGVVVGESYLELEVAWMLQWAEFHANWGA